MGAGVLQNQHTRTLLSVDVEDDVHVRSTMRKMTRAAQHQYELPDLGSCLPVCREMLRRV